MDYKILVNCSTWIVIVLWSFCVVRSHEMQCEQLPGAYARDVYGLRCCKGRELELPWGKRTYLDLSVDTQCQSEIIKKYPDDELSTSMWKVQACNMKKEMSLSDKYSYKDLVDSLTKFYTVEDNVQSLIKDSNKECPDGDKESEELKKMQAYLNCFYKNEQQVCEVESANVTSYKKELLEQYNISDSYPNSCEPSPGLWYQKYSCCNGKRTPDMWLHMRAAFPPEKRNYTSYSQCYKEAQEQSNSYKLPENATREDFEKQGDHKYSHRLCNFGCDLNPGMVLTGVENQTINFNIDNALDLLYSSFTTKMMNILKAYVKEKISTEKVALTKSQMWEGIGVSFEEIERKFGTSDNSLRYKYFCSYYRGLVELANKAIDNYCSPASN